MTATDPRRLLRSMLVTSVVSSVLVAVLYLVAIRTTFGQQFDDIAFAGRDIEDPEITRLTNDVLHRVTRFTLLVATVGLVVLALLRRRLGLAVAVGAAVTISVVTTEVLKLHFLSRPALDDVAGIDINSYPSGHATIATALSLGLVMVTPHHRRWIAAGVGMAFASLFGVGVLATGWHRPSDSIGAVLVCIAVFCGVTAVLIQVAGVDRLESAGVERWLHGRSIVTIVAVAVSISGVVLFETLRADSLRTVQFAWDYVAVAAVILVFAASAIVGYARALGGLSLAPPSSRDT